MSEIVSSHCTFQLSVRDSVQSLHVSAQCQRQCPVRLTARFRSVSETVSSQTHGTFPLSVRDSVQSDSRHVSAQCQRQCPVRLTARFRAVSETVSSHGTCAVRSETVSNLGIFLVSVRDSVQSLHVFSQCLKQCPVTARFPSVSQSVQSRQMSGHCQRQCPVTARFLSVSEQCPLTAHFRSMSRFHWHPWHCLRCSAMAGPNNRFSLSY